MYLSLYCKGSKRVTQGFTVRLSERPNRTAIYWPPLLWPSALCLSRSPGLLNRRPRGPALCRIMAFFTVSYHQLVSKTTGGPDVLYGRVWLSLPHLVSDVSDLQLIRAPRVPSAGLSLPHLISNFSGPQLIRAPRVPSAGLSLPHLISNFSGPQLIRGPKGPLRRAFSTTSYQQLFWTPTVSLPVLTELYNSSTSTQSPTQSLEWHVWSSSSGNNCHAVQWSLSSGASVYECTMGILPCLISSAKSAHSISFDYWPLECVTSFRCITLEWHVCPGRRSKYNTYNG